MKIWCEACEAKEAVVFCTADEAALCRRCDLTVHSANKLASTHTRLPFVLPPAACSDDSRPLCDICRESRAMLFCREDRAILCRNCDISIHKTNKFAQNHNRFILADVKLSSSSLSSSQSPTVCSHKKSQNRPGSVSLGLPGSSPAPTSVPQQLTTTNLREYLMESIPGWEVSDLLDPHYDYN